MSPDGTMRAEAASDDGMGRLSRTGFEPALLRLIGPWLGSARMPVVACGMVGSRQGWVEAPYATVPCRPLPGALVAAPVTDPRIDVRVVPGVRQLDPADVMRGEETQIAGFLATTPGFDGVICLPGTHSKWVQVSAGEIVSFRSFMTGELFELLSTASVLRHTVGEGWDAEAFVQAVSDAMSRPEAIAARLFSIRAEALLKGLDPSVARARLSGALIGLELAGARPYWLGQDVALVGAPRLSAIYAAALGAQGVPTRAADGAAMTRAGLAAARLATMETTR
ncbi:2-dehydro-3-deoxygalactonokinase [Palleronia sp. KMU-117]|uniref:2-dehydro-3-deoxygalactonokinase n=1 Tax=Palleronia sp. KMU-117 TaxID=3434108 RepID=UPI003D733714